MQSKFSKLGLLAVMLAFPAALCADSMFWTSPDPELPPMIPGNPGATIYITGPNTHAIYASPGGTIDLINVRHTNFSNVQRSTSDPDEMDTFDSSLYGMVDHNGGTALFGLDGPVTVTEFGKAGQVTGTFSTQMDSMDMTGYIDGHSVEVKLDPARPTLGSTTITDLGDGMYHIDSFFDVFTEISIDHGAFSPQIGGPSVVTLTCTPEPSTWGLFCCGAMGLAGIGARRFARLRGTRQTG